MSEIALAKINSFASHPTRADFVPPEDPILEVPLSELQGLLNEMLLTHNLLAEMVRDAGILRGRELAGLTEKHATSLKAEKSPLTKILLLNAYIRQFLIKVRDRLKSMPTPEKNKVVQVCSKIAARAIQIVNYIQAMAQDGSQRKEIALDSQQARILFSGAGSEPVSRKETIRAMRRAEALCPALHCGHRPNDGRQTMRLTIDRRDLGIAPEFGYCDTWQRSKERVGMCL